MNIGIMFGGKSVEHEISILTAIDSYKKINGNKYLIYVSKDQIYYLADADILKKYKEPEKYYKRITFINGGIKIHKRIIIDFMFNMMHGLNGEDGMCYSLCMMHNIKVIGSENIISGISARKDWFKKICPLDTIEFKYVDYNSKLDYPVIVKPANLGSSIGISVVRNDEEYKNALDKAYSYSDVVIAEEFLEDAREFNCAVAFDEVSNVYEVTNGFLNYDKKYKEDITSFIIEGDLANKIKEYSKQIYSLGYSGVIRIDYLYSNGVLYVNEVNPIPGLMSSYMFDFNVFDYLIKMTNKKYLLDNKIKSYNQDVLCLKFKK